jgi:hypothetical protein
MPSLYETTPETGTVSSTNLTSLYSNTSSFTTGLVNSSVYSVSGGLGVTVNPTTGNVVVSIGQDVATTANVTFVNVTATGNLSNNYFTLANSAGSNGQVLTTNGAGVTTWTTPSGLGLVTSITGTANQIIASSPTGAITLSTPQDIATTSNPTFAGATLGNVTVGIVDNNTIATTTGNLIIGNENDATYYPVITSGAATPAIARRLTTSTAGVARALSLRTESTGTPVVGFGTALEFQVEAQPGNVERAGSINVVSTDITATSEDFQMQFGLMQNGATLATRLKLYSNGDLDMFDGGKFAIVGLTTGYSQFGAPATGSNLTYTLPGAAGAANTVLTNDGSGILSWALPGGGGSTFGNITIAVDTDNTISTTSGDLVLNSATGTIDANSADVNVGSLTVDGRATLDTTTLTTTSTATVSLVSTTRNVMKVLVNIIQGANVHCVEALVLGTSATTAMVTTYGEMYNNISLASFTADTSGGSVRLLITPTSSTSTVFTTVRTSLT